MTRKKSFGEHKGGNAAPNLALDESGRPAIRNATLDALGPTFVEDVGRHVPSIFVDVDGAPVSMGTGFQIHTGRDHVLVTAAHVLNGMKNGM